MSKDELKKGSLEYIIAGLHEEAAKHSERFFGKVCQPRVLNTFTGYALLQLEDNRGFRAQYELTESGEPKILSVEPADIGPLSRNARLAAAGHQAQQLVNKVFSNESDSIQVEDILRLFRLLPDDFDKSEEELVAEAVVDRLNHPRFWKDSYTERLGKIRTFLSPTLKLIDEGRLTTKFSKLYDGSIKPEEVHNYMELVTSDLKDVIGRLREARDVISQGLTVIKANLSEDAGLGGAEQGIFLLEFSEDLAKDIDEVLDCITTSRKNLSNAKSLGIVYDAIAENLFAYQLAGAFLKETARRLAETKS